MKKLLVLVSVLSIMLSANAVEQAKPANVSENQKRIQEHRMNRDLAFEKRLNLTEVQKLKARDIRKKGHEKLAPIVEQIRAKKQEAEMIRRSRMAVQMQEEKLAVIDAELKILENKAQSIRKANMKEFESILTREQRRTLKQMKKEGRKRYHDSHPVTRAHLYKNFGCNPQNK
ncbi:MAG: hypothetical protein E7Z92_04550 [Cyanobacteria bacterium SIG31]|nr:hypothetical protein [Cyanobacteria bacterium SIG31]